VVKWPRRDASPRQAVPSTPSGGGALRAVLAEIRASRGDVSLTEVARRVGVSRDEVDAMVDYWVSRGALTSTEIGRTCGPGTSGGCGGCPSASRTGTPGCGTDGPASPVLLAITARPRS
jgi:hypothetical protein